MTIKELAERLNATPEEIFGHYERIHHPVPREPNFELNDEFLRMAIPNYRGNKDPEENSQEPPKPEKRKDEKRQVSEFERALALPRTAALKAIRSANQVETLIFTGTLVERKGGESGDFVDVLSIDGKRLFYPSLESYNTPVPISRIAIERCEGLTFGRRYSFEVELEELNKRRVKVLPFLLKTTVELVHQAEQLSDVLEAISNKKKLLEEIQKTFLEGQERILVEEAREQELLVSFQEELKKQEQLIASKHEEIQDIQDKLDTMESTVNAIRERLDLCRQLQFVSDEEAGTYLQVLQPQHILLSNHLDFKEQLDSDFKKLADHVHGYLHFQKNLIYTPFQIQNFLTLLRTHDLIVLSGLSGSGKTQIVKAFADALGGVAKIIPVKPNWTSSEDLIGYYNPIQMSFLPTPFTEAIVEAIHNPNQLYLICLDEMNLARVEYYFADFLSKLEERVNAPEIELYAKHQEDIFISEFNTLLSLIESSIEGVEVNSWQDFLNNSSARTRFMEFLGNADKESLLQLHSKMKRRLIDILKFPSTLRIPENVRFIGAINIDETTHYFSPKILDRIHVVKFENPLTFSDEVKTHFKDMDAHLFESPVHFLPQDLAIRGSYPKLDHPQLLEHSELLSSLNTKYLLPLKIDFGIRSTRQSMHYIDLSRDLLTAPLNAVIIQKVLPRFVFDGNEKTRNGKTKLEILKEMVLFLEQNVSASSVQDGNNPEETRHSEANASEHLKELISVAEEIGNGQVNFFA